MITQARAVCALYNLYGASTKAYKDAFEELALKLGYRNSLELKAKLTKYANAHNISYTEYVCQPGKWEEEFKNGARLRAVKKVVLTTNWSTQLCKSKLELALLA